MDKKIEINNCFNPSTTCRDFLLKKTTLVIPAGFDR